MTLLTIGHAAKASGLSVKMIRHYEQSGLLKKSIRTDAGYRVYNTDQINQLRFIRQARNLGFSLADVKSLLELWQNPDRESRSVKQLAQKHLDEIASKISELKHMQKVLKTLSDSCLGDDSPHCNILNQLAKPG